MPAFLDEEEHVKEETNFMMSVYHSFINIGNSKTEAKIDKKQELVNDNQLVEHLKRELK